MTSVRFLGAQPRDATGVDERLLDVARAAGQPLEGACDGQLSCATCHVIVDDDDFRLLQPASADEEAMLDLVSCVTRTSRLACQIRLDHRLARLTVTIPDH